MSGCTACVTLIAGNKLYLVSSLSAIQQIHLDIANMGVLSLGQCW